MTTEEINRQLYRPLQDGSRYNHLLPQSACKSKLLANGNTTIALREMRKWAFKHVDHTEMLAAEFIRPDFDATINAIQYFLFNHIQYTIDGEDQNLKSPACAWQTRQQGTDCKSYSIFASTILLNLGIKHYLRRIKQDPLIDAFTHVLVIIPLDQDNPKITKNSRFYEDYLIIDGTIKDNVELAAIETDDLYMEPKLKIYGLAAPGVGVNFLGCGCSEAQTSSPLAVQPIAPIDKPLALNGVFDNISGFFSGGWSPSCVGGSYDDKDLNVTRPAITQGFDDLFASFNAAIVSKNTTAITSAINLLLSASTALLDHTTATAGYGWNSRCSKDTTKKFREIAAYFKDLTHKAAFPFLQKYFSFNTTFQDVSNVSYPFITRTNEGLKKDQFVRSVNTIQVTELALKTETTAIPVFEFTPYILDNIGSTSFDVNSFINGLTEIAAQYGVIDAGGNTNGGGFTGGQVIPLPPSNEDNDSDNTLPIVLGLSATAAAVIFAFRKKIFK